MKRKISKFETWLYDNVFNDQDSAYRHDIYSIYCKIKRTIRTIKSWSIFLKFWKIPSYIDSFNSAVEFAECQIKELRDEVENKDHQIEELINYLVDEFMEQQMTEEEANREAYKLAYYDTWQHHIPSKYLTKREADRQFEKSLDDYVTYDPIADATYHQMMDYELGQLKKGGIYETSY